MILQIDIDKKKYKVEFTKGTGAGGQHRNKVETCAVVTHIATGLKEKCEDTRYKNKNLETAYKRLVNRIVEIQKQKLHNEKNDESNKAIETNGVIRTYNYQRNEVKDHRTGAKANLTKVLNGELDLLNNVENRKKRD